MDSVHKTVGDKWPASAGRLTQKHLSAAVQNTGEKNVDSSPMANR